jgi:hypothetical protein
VFSPPLPDCHTIGARIELCQIMERKRFRGQHERWDREFLRELVSPTSERVLSNRFSICPFLLSNEDNPLLGAIEIR